MVKVPELPTKLGRRMSGWMDMDGWMDGWMEGWKDGWMEGK
jgi:hypothetical protein